jgi:hypothetical protein
MDLNFNQVSYDGEIGDFSEDELRELISNFEDAQESNVAEFKQAVEALNDVDESKIEDFEKAREDLIEDVTEAEAFEDVPLTEDALEDSDFSELQEWRDFVEAQAEPEGEAGDEDDEGDFNDFGQKAPVDDGEDDEDFVEDVLNDVPGLNA